MWTAEWPCKIISLLAMGAGTFCIITADTLSLGKERSGTKAAKNAA